MKHIFFARCRVCSILTRFLFGIGLLITMLVGSGTSAVSTVAKSDLAYELLILSGAPQDALWSDLDHDQVVLNVFDIDTGENTLIATDDMPLRQDAFSPDGQYLAVYRSNQVCIIDHRWQTVFCLAPDVVALARARRTLAPTIFWETDSASFWSLSDILAPSIVQISVPDGEIMRSLRIENPSGRVADVNLFTIYPIGRRFLLGFNGDCCYLFDLNTGDFLYRLDHYYCLSPDAQLVESYGEGDIGGIFRLESSPDMNEVIAVPVAQINPPLAWSNTPELAWAESDRNMAASTVRAWSHDSRKIAFHRSILQGGRDVGFVGVYFLDTQEVRILGQDQWEFADIHWSPDDSALAVFPRDAGYPEQSGYEITVYTLDGSTIPVLNEDEMFRIYSINWLPHGWLPLNE